MRGGETKILKRGGKLGQEVGALKGWEGGGWNPLTNYAYRDLHICFISSYFFTTKQKMEDCLMFIIVSH